ncbi:MAG: PAN/Apple domain-containing protein [Thermochromatium sp.]
MLLLCVVLAWPSDRVYAAERAIELLPGIDYFGRDDSTLKSVTLEACREACLNDDRCRAFTYNTKAEWCFLKEDFKDPRPFAGAVSGRVIDQRPASGPGERTVDRTLSFTTSAARLTELAFLPPHELGEARRSAAKLASAPAPEVKLATLIEQAHKALQSKQPA